MSTPPTGFLPFCIFVISVLSSKILHIYIHIHSIWLPSLLLFLPTLLLPDILLICGIWLLCLGYRGNWAILGCSAVGVLSMLTYGAAAMSLGFFYRTGGEVDWKTSMTFASDPKGMKVLMSEAQNTLVPAVALLLLSWLARPLIFIVSNTLVASFRRPLRRVPWYVRPYLNNGYNHLTFHDLQDNHPNPDFEQSEEGFFPDDRSSFTESEKHPEEMETLLDHHEKEYLRHEFSPSLAHMKHRVCQWKAYLQQGNLPATLTTLVSRIVELNAWKEHLQCAMPCALASTKLRIIALLTVLYIIRPSKPYNHLTNTLPIQLLEVLDFGSAGGCHIHSGSSHAIWPFPEQVDEEHWILPVGEFKGWAPGVANEYIRGYQNRTPDWLYDIPPDGFYRWQTIARHHDPPIDVPDRELDRPGGTLHEEDLKKKCADLLEQLTDYNPVDDPLRITNLDQDLLKPFQKLLKEGAAVINHVIIVQMESMRKELFPLLPGSAMHKLILESHPTDQWDDINGKLNHLSRNTQEITGQFGSFTNTDDSEHRHGDLAGSSGGININGALTGSTFSFKSFLGSHCGVWPLPVNMLEETYSEIYQPCLPHILNLFNAGKTDADRVDEESIKPLDRTWKSVFLQSITELYDRQDQLNKQIGFDQVFAKETIEKEPNFQEEEINYYGYPERAIKPHMRKALEDAIRNDQRLFLSHFTSTTHHPWTTTKDFDDIAYMGEGHDDFNQHLNSIRFHDEWLGEILELVEGMGVSNETLIVFVGDHGTAFSEDGAKAKLGPHENAHISNWRIPLVFRHPQLPRMQLDVNATSISILPTILDLLIQTNSLNDRDKSIAADLIHDYEGQSLIRPYVTFQGGRRAWNFGIVNAGGGMILITSADAPWKLSVPLGSIREYCFADLTTDPRELEPMEYWVFEDLLPKIRNKHGKQAEEWAVEAKKVIEYFVDRQHRLWRYADQL